MIEVVYHISRPGSDEPAGSDDAYGWSLAREDAETLWADLGSALGKGGPEYVTLEDLGKILGAVLGNPSYDPDFYQEVVQDPGIEVGGGDPDEALARMAATAAAQSSTQGRRSPGTSLGTARGFVP